jgi:membrane-associated phospholipid phosphatase
LVSQSLNQVVKFSTGRERPFVHALPEADKPHTAQPNDNQTSFYSGHTNLTFSLAVAAGTVASMRGYRWAHWVWIVGLTVASLTGYLRIAADRHYLSDVLTGATLGSALGFVLPYAFHNRQAPPVSVSTLPHGVLVSLHFRH